MATPRRSSLRLRALAGAGAAALLLSSCSLFGGDEPADDPSGSSTAERGAGVLVALDGWSRTMLPSKVEWSSGGRTGAVQFAAAGSEDISELLELAPQQVTELAARLLTADPRLACTSDGCTAGDAEVDLDGLVDVAAGPYGDVLAAAGVEHPVYVGFVPVQGSAPIQLSAGNDKISVNVAGAVGAEEPAIGDLPAPQLPDGSDDDPAEPSDAGSEAVPPSDIIAENPDVSDAPTPVPTIPIDQVPADAADVTIPETVPDTPDTTVAPAPVQATTSVVVLAAGAGRLFQPVAPWLTGEADEGSNPFGATGFNPQLSPPLRELDISDGPGPLTGGLAMPDGSVTSELSVSQLTAYTSPTTGCGVGIVCAPTDEGVTIEELSSSSAQVCDSAIARPFEEPRAPQPGEDPVITLVSRSQRWDLSGGPRNQFGFWDTDPEEGNVLFWPAAAPQVDGDVTRYVRTVELYNGAGQLLDITGEVTDADVDWDVDRVLELYGDRFARCTPEIEGAPTVIEP